jgi:FkbM family methyltransferase
MKHLIVIVLAFIASSCLQAQTLINNVIVHSGDVVFDVGAHIGEKTEEYLKLGARLVVAFEPQPACIPRLIKKFKNNNRIALEFVGLSSTDGTIPFYHFDSEHPAGIATFSKDLTEYGRFVEEKTVWSKVSLLPVTTLDTMITKHGLPHFCKIDVEGYEYEVLQGLSQPIPIISFEFMCEYFDKAELCLAYLMNLGYRYFNFGDNWNNYFDFDDWVSLDELRENLKTKMISNRKLWGDIYAKV